MKKLKVLVVLLLSLSLLSCVTTNSSNDMTYAEDFEKRTRGWGPRGPETIVLSSDIAKSGEKSLMVTNRTATWNGPMKDLSTKLRGGRTYKIGAWVTYLEGPEELSISMSIQRAVGGGPDEYNNIGAVNVEKGKWSFIDAVYIVPESDYVSTINLYFETAYKSDSDVTADDIVPFYLDNISVKKMQPLPPPKAESDIPALKDSFDFPIGAAIKYSYLQDHNMYNEMLRHYNVFVFDNDMKMDAMQPREGQFVFDRADALVAYCEENNIPLRGHTLLWHNQHPSWFFTDSSGKDVSKEVLLERIKTHIQTIVSRYKGKDIYWDVVNEVLAEDGTFRNSKYYQIVGSEEYIEKAFMWAHEADPDAKLYINDYGVCHSGGKQEGYYQLVKSLQDKNIPITGVGFQSHINVTFPNANDVRNAIRRFAGLGLDVQVTELDLSIYKNPGEKERRFTKSEELNQAYKFRTLFNMYREEAALGNLSMVVLWGIADEDTWLDQFPVPGRKDYPLLFNTSLKAKAAYWALVDTDKLDILIKWMDAIRTDTTVTSIDDEAWTFASYKDIADIDGNSKGQFKVLWDENKMYVMANIDDSTIDEDDSVTLYFEPKNKKEATLTEETKIVTFTRDNAVTITDSGYVIYQEFDFPVKAKMRRKYGFDIRVNDNGKLYSYNDYRNTQDDQTANYSTINLSKLSPMCTASEGSIVVDGIVEPEWDNATSFDIKVVAEGVAMEGSTFKAKWDSEYLYVLMNVVDDLLNDDSKSPWEQDSIEVFIDQNNAKLASYDDDDAQYRISFNNYQTTNGGDIDKLISKPSITENGYLVEIAIPVHPAYLKSETLLGFDVQVNNADASGKRVGMRNWVNDTNLGYQDPSGFGVIQLK